MLVQTLLHSVCPLGQPMVLVTSRPLHPATNSAALKTSSNRGVHGDRIKFSSPEIPGNVARELRVATFGLRKMTDHQMASAF